MKKRMIVLSGCLVLFVGVLSTQSGHFRAGLNITPTGTPKVKYEYYYNDDEELEDTDLADESNLSGDDTDSEKFIEVDTKPDSYTVLVNREYPISKQYVPDDLVVPDVLFSFYGTYEKSYVRQRAASALEDLFAGARESGYTLKLVSAYRSYSRQKQIYNNNVRKKGAEKADMVSAIPGSSEHQTGLAIDVSCSAVGCTLEESFGNTAEGKWLAKNCYKYGFIIRYPKNKTDITGYSYEPWHIRYVGKNLAKHLNKKKITLEEYYRQTTENDAVQKEPIQDTDIGLKNEPQMTAAPTPNATIRPTIRPNGHSMRTAKPGSVNRPKATKAPTAKPKATKKPKVTAEPKATKKPKATAKPKATKKPKTTAKPKATLKPAETKAPETSADAISPNTPKDTAGTDDSSQDKE